MASPKKGTSAETLHKLLVRSGPSSISQLSTLSGMPIYRVEDVIARARKSAGSEIFKIAGWARVGAVGKNNPTLYAAGPGADAVKGNPASVAPRREYDPNLNAFERIFGKREKVEA